jgi:hypothetical protein
VDCPQLQTFNQSLVGRVNLRLVIVNGPSGTGAAFNLLEIVRIRALTIAGTKLLSSNAAGLSPPPRLSWTVRTDIVDIPTAPLPANPAPNGHAPRSVFEAREAPWRDPALVKLVGIGGGPGFLALRANTLGTADHAVTVMWTRYEAQWVGYANSDLGRAILCWPLFDVPPVVRTRVPLKAAAEVIAHELCHLFGAPDEAAPCSVLDARGCGFGSQDMPNLNCETTAGTGVTSCLMRNPAHQLLCRFSRVHLGWPLA